MKLRIEHLENADREKEKRIEFLESKQHSYDKAAAKMGGIGITLIFIFSIILYGWDALKDKLIGVFKL